MLKRSKTPTVSTYKAVSRLIRPLMGGVLGLGMLLAGPSNLSVHAAEQVNPSSVEASVNSPAVMAVHPVEHSLHMGQRSTNAISSAEVIATTSSVFPSNGVYLYGQSPQPEQVGSAYAVMEIVDNQAVGAFYMPQSSFDCFYGSVEPDTLSLNVVSSYDRATHEYSVAFATGTAIATTDEAVAPVELEGFHAIETVSNNDHRILGMCRASLAGQI